MYTNYTRHNYVYIYKACRIEQATSTKNVSVWCFLCLAASLNFTIGIAHSLSLCVYISYSCPCTIVIHEGLMIYNILYKCANLQSYLIWICTFMVVYSHNMCRAHNLKL